MGVRDALLLNTTGSNFQALQTNDTARVKGDLSLQKDDGTEVLGIDVSTATLNLTGGITGSGNISSSLSSTGSFGRVVATTFHGDGTALRDTLPRSVGIVTQSAQLAAQISGAFTSGFEMSASISGSATSTGSFGRVEGELFFGDGSGIKTTLPRSPGIVTSSAQLAADISGSFTSGFEFDGTISGSATSTGSFGRIDATTITGDATPIISSLPFPSGLVSGSGILASDISGSFNKGFGLTGNILTPVDAWTTGHDMNQCRYYFGAKGYVDAAIAAGGALTHWPVTYTDKTEMWDGTSWSEVTDMILGRNGGYGGTVASGYFSAGGAPPNYGGRTEEWNGTNWSEATSFGQREGDVGGCSPTQVYGIGSMYSGGHKFVKYNAGVCTEGPFLTIGNCAPFGWDGASGRFGHAGNSECVLVFTNNFTEEYDGSSWSVLSHDEGQYNGRYEGFTTENPNPAKLNGAAPNLACLVRGNTGAGTTNDAYSYGGEVGPIGGPAWYKGCGTAMFQRWDGVSWSRGVVPPVFDAASAQGIGDGPNAFVLGGITLGNKVITSGSIFLEGQSSASFGLLTFVSASGNAKSLQSQLTYTTNPAFNVLTGSSQIASQISGSFNKGFEFSGHIRQSSGGVISLGDSLIEAQTGATGGSMNKGTAFVAGGVYGTSRETCACHQQYNGTSWSEAADLIDARKCLIEASGDSNAAIVHGGYSGPATNKVEEWNGSAWSEVNTFHPARNVANQSAAAGESSEAALRWGWADAAEWNGTNWSEFQTTAESGLDGVHYNQAGTGTVNAALQFAGQTPFNFSSTGYDRSFRAFREYDGSNWSECPIMIFHTAQMGAFGSSNDAVVAGGNIRAGTDDGGKDGVPFNQIGHSANYHPSLNYRSTYNQYWDGSVWSVTGRLLCKVVGCNTAGSGFGGASGGGASNQGFIAGGIMPSSPYTTTATQLFDEVPVSGSFGRLVATTFHGDGSGLTNVLPSGLVSSSAQLGISGSFTSGFGFSGEISGSATSTGSFGRIEADFLHGDGGSIKDSLPRSTGIVSGAAQIASNISGSFTSGFGYDGLIQAFGGTWSAGGNLNQNRFCNVTVGNNADAIVASGFAFPGGHQSFVVCSETYNGSSWSETNDINTGRHAAAGAGTGTNTALIFGGDASGTKTETEEWNGTNWSEVNDLISGRYGMGGTGTTEAAIAVGGYGTTPTKCNEEWNGTNWSEVGDLITDSPYGSTSGTVNDAIHKRNSYAPLGYRTEFFDGSTWSEGADSTIDRRELGLTVAGTTSCAIAFGGMTPSIPVTDTDIYDGTSWSIGAGTIDYGRRYGCGAGSNLSAGGAIWAAGQCFPNSPSYALTRTDHYDLNVASASFHNIQVTSLSGDGSKFSASLQTQILTASSQIAANISGSFTSGFDLRGGVSASFGLSGIAFSAGGNLNASTTFAAGLGTKSAALSVGTQNASAKTEEYNGSSWSELNDLNTGRGALVGTGTTEASVVYGGQPQRTCTEVWNGTSWSEANDMIMARFAHQKLGITSQAALAVGGNTTESGYQDNDVEDWNGTNWSAGTAVLSNAGYGSSAGTYDSGLIFKWTGSETFCWNGSAWSEVADRAIARHCTAGAGSSNDALITGGNSPTVGNNTVCTELYDGNSWSTGPNLATGRSMLSSADGGNTGTGNTMVFGAGVTTEEYTNSVSTGSFHHLRGTVGGEIKTDMFNITSSTFKLPLFSDADLNYHSIEPEEGTGSMSGSVDRVADVNVLNKPGNFFFHSDYNALGFTYVSASVYSQSIDFVTCAYHSGSVYTSASAFITQSHYCYHNVIQYITGSYT